MALWLLDNNHSAILIYNDVVLRKKKELTYTKENEAHYEDRNPLFFSN